MSSWLHCSFHLHFITRYASASILVAAKKPQRGCLNAPFYSTGVHRFHFVYALLSLYRSAFRSAAFVSINVLVSSCFTVTRVSCELPFYIPPQADNTVLTNRKYGVATVWYAANCLVVVISSHFAGSSQHSVLNPA